MAEIIVKRMLFIDKPLNNLCSENSNKQIKLAKGSSLFIPKILSPTILWAQCMKKQVREIINTLNYVKQPNIFSFMLITLSQT